MQEARHEQEDDFVKNDESDSIEDDVDDQIDQQIAVPTKLFYQNFQAHNKKRDKDGVAGRPESANNIQSGSRQRIESARYDITNKRDFPERKIEQAISSSLTPKISSARRIKQAAVGISFSFVLRKKKEAFYERFSNYVKNNRILPEDFWSLNKDKLITDEFRECLDIIGFNYSKKEFEDVVFEIADTDFKITLPAFCSKIDEWKGFLQEKALETLKDNAMKVVQDTKRKLQSADGKKKNMMIRPMSGNLYSGSARPFSGISAISAKSKNTMYTTGQEFNQNNPGGVTMTSNKSAAYIKQTKEREAKKEQLLALTISRGKNEAEYDCLFKMGDANEKIQAMGESITYRAYRGADGNLKVHVYDLDRFMGEFSIKEFSREYNSLRQRYYKKQNLKIWDVLNQNSRNKTQFYFSSQKGKKNEAHSPEKNLGDLPAPTNAPSQTQANGRNPILNTKLVEPKKVLDKAEKQAELKRVLFDTMKLTKTLKNQLKKLEECGLVYDSHPVKYQDIVSLYNLYFYAIHFSS